MSDHRRRIFQGTLVGALFAGCLLLASGSPAVVPPQPVGATASVHTKNAETPGWMLELQTRNARQLPVTVQNDEPSFWI